MKPGTIGWIDLTVADAPRLRDFYSAVAGWTSSPIAMGDYEDYCMLPPGATDAVAGICHARGANSTQPAAWLFYIVVEDLDASLQQATERGGRVLAGPRALGDGSRFVVVEDPAGAAFGLFQAAKA